MNGSSCTAETIVTHRPSPCKLQVNPTITALAILPLNRVSERGWQAPPSDKTSAYHILREIRSALQEGDKEEVEEFIFRKVPVKVSSIRCKFGVGTVRADVAGLYSVPVV